MRLDSGCPVGPLIAIGGAGGDWTEEAFEVIGLSLEGVAPELAAATGDVRGELVVLQGL